MSVLIVEDNPERIKLFRQGFIGVSTTVLTTASLALDWLKDHTPKLLLLDYDLHEHGTPIKLSGCGADVARGIVRYAKRFERTMIVVHSLNQQGAARIMKTLNGSNLSASQHPYLWKEPENMERLAALVRQS
jgi:CheY-like chemotaxis protein